MVMKCTSAQTRFGLTWLGTSVLNCCMGKRELLRLLRFAARFIATRLQIFTVANFLLLTFGYVRMRLCE